MAKKRKKSPSKKRHLPKHKPLSAKAREELAEIEWLIDRKQWSEALEALQALDQRYPRRVDILEDLAYVSLELSDNRLYLHYVLQLQKLRPNDPIWLFNLGSAYAINLFPALAVHTQRRFLEKHPSHELAADVKESLAGMEDALQEMLADLDAGDAEPEALALGSDSMRVALDTGNLVEARQHAAHLLELKPDFFPALNNLSLAESLDGNFSRAIELAERVLALDPDNFQATGNVIKFYYLNGQDEAAQEKAAAFEALQSPDLDIWLKKIEAFTILGDDERVQKTVQRAGAADVIEDTSAPGLCYHLAAVAEMRLGNEAQAKKYWRRALKLNPNLNLAGENLADLEKPVGERHAPWPFPGNQWIASTTVKEIGKVVQKFSGRTSEKARQKAIERLMTDHPELNRVIPILLERGDPWGRDFAITFVSLTNIPELVAQLPEFALSKHGPDAIRHQAATIARQAGLLPSKEVRMWMQGHWQDILLLDFEIHYDHDEAFDTPELRKLMDTFSRALDRGDLDKAEESLQQTLELMPDDPSTLNNLAAIYSQQGRQEESQELVARILRDFPDYFFGITSAALEHIQNDELEEAREKLKKLILRDRLHISEFTALARAHIQLYLAEDNSDGAGQWLQMWSDIDPDHPELDTWRFRVMSHDKSMMDHLRQAFGMLKT